jgi:autotransporter-associated beta strand protein
VESATTFDSSVGHDVLLKGDDLLRLERDPAVTENLVLTGFTLSAPARSQTFSLILANTNLSRQVVAVADVVHYTTAAGTAATGKVQNVTVNFQNGVPTTVLVVNPDPGFAMPAADSAFSVDAHTQLTGLTFLVKFAPGVETLASAPFDLAVGFLDVSSNLNVELKGALQVLLGFGVEKGTGFFIKTDFSDLDGSNEVGFQPVTDKEITLSGDVFVDGQLTVHIGALGLSANFNEVVNGQEKDAPDVVEDFMHAEFFIDLLGTPTNNKATVGQLFDALTQNGFGGVFDVGLGFEAQVNAQLSATIDPSLPRLTADFVLTWGIADNTQADGFRIIDVTNPAERGTTPTIGLNNVSLDLGQVISKAVRPVLEKVQKFLPQDVVNFLNSKIYEKFDVTGKDLLYAALGLAPSNPTRKVIDFLLTLSSFLTNNVTQAQGSANNVKLNFGSVTLAGGADGEVTVDASKSLEDGTTGTITSSTPTGNNQPAPAAIPGANLPGAIGDFFENLGQKGITFPILKLSNLVKLFMDQPVDLVMVAPPPIELGMDDPITFFHLVVVPFPGFTAELDVNGKFNFVIRLAGGLDTSGLKAGNFLNGFYLADNDPGPDGELGTADDLPRHEFSAVATVTIEGGLGVGIGVVDLVEVTGKASLTGHVDLDLHDPNPDGKLYFQEIVSQIGQPPNPLALLDLCGGVDLTVGLRFAAGQIEIRGKKFALYSAEWQDTIHLFSFGDCDEDEGTGGAGGGGGSGGASDIPGHIGKVIGDVLELLGTEGEFPNGTEGAFSDLDDQVTVEYIDGNDDPTDGAIDASVPVTAGAAQAAADSQFTVATAGASYPTGQGVQVGQSVLYTSGGLAMQGIVTALDANSITVLPVAGVVRSASGVDLPDAGTTLSVRSGRETMLLRRGGVFERFGPGERGDNFIADASLIRTITGPAKGGMGAGNDRLIIDPRFTGRLVIDGGDGDDYIVRGSGANEIKGGKGNDTIRVAPVLVGLGADDRRARGSRLEGGDGDDHITGSVGDDVILGGDGEDFLEGVATLEALPGTDAKYVEQDNLVGGGDNDHLTVGLGSHFVVGDYDDRFDVRPTDARLRKEGQDNILAGDGANRIWGDNKGPGLDADGPEPDAARTLGNSIFLGFGANTVFAGSGPDTVRVARGISRTGTDVVNHVFGGKGADQLVGGDEADELVGEDGDDLIDGGKGNNRLFGGNNVLGPDALRAGRTLGADQIIAADGDNLIDGSDSDTVLVIAGNGSNSVLGSRGADDIETGSGRDFIVAGPGGDFIRPGAGDDDIVGGKGQAGSVRFDLDLPDVNGSDVIDSSAGFKVIVANTGTIDPQTRTATLSTDASTATRTVDFSRSKLGVTIDLDSKVVQQVNAETKTRLTDGVEDFHGTDLADTVFVDATTVPRTVDGGGQAVGTTDVLNVDAGGLPVSITDNVIRVKGRQSITFSNFERVVISNTSGAVTVTGNSASNTTVLRQDTEGVSYQIKGGPAVVLTDVQTLRYNSGDGDDTLVVDLSAGNPIPTGGLTFDGGTQTGTTGDQFRLVGTNVETAAFTPSAATVGAGVLTVDGRTVNLLGTEGLRALRLSELKVTTPSSDDVLRIDAAPSPLNTTSNQLTGTSGGVAIIPVSFQDVTTFTLDTGANDGTSGNDSVTLGSAGWVATGLTSFALTSGNGSDTLRLETGKLSFQVAGGTFSYDGGAGADRVVGVADVNWTLTASAVSSSGGGSVSLTNLAGEQAELTGGASVNTFTVNGWTGTATLDGAAGTDQLSLPLLSGTVTTVDTLTLTGNVSTAASAASLGLNGSVNLGTVTRTFTVADGSAAQDLVIKANLSGSGGLTRAGAGTLVLSGMNSYTGTTTVSAGTLLVNGDNSHSAVTVSGGTLGGVGTTGAVTASSGTVSPGTSPGALSVEGDLKSGSGATYRFEINGTLPGKTYDTLDVHGGVSLGGATLDATVGFASAVGNRYTLISNDGTDAVAGTFAGLPQGTTFTIGSVRYQISYTGGDGNDVVLTHVNTPALFPGRAVTAVIDEGGVATLTGNVGEVDPLDDFTLVVNWGDGSPVETHTYAAGTATVTLEHRYLDSNPDGYTIAMKWFDPQREGNSGNLTTVVNNLAPTASLSGPASGVRGQERTFHVTTTDPSPVDEESGFTYRVSWGDGTTEVLTGSSQEALRHTYTKSGTYDVTVTATDKDGAKSAVVKRQITVRAAEVQDGVLVVGGTTDADRIRITPADASGSLDVTINGKSQGTFGGVEKVVVHGQDGDDEVTLEDARIRGRTVTIDVPAVLDGGDGDDQLDARGTTVGAVLLGGAGGDVLFGGQGRDILIGGTDKDKLHAEGQEDIVLGGSTAHDKDLEALDALLAEWGRGDVDRKTRIRHLTGQSAGGLNGDALLTATTVIDDAARDKVFALDGFDWEIDS